MDDRTKGIFTKAKELYKKIRGAETYLVGATENAGLLKHAEVEINSYYALLDDDSPEQKDLKERFDALATWKNKQLDALEVTLTGVDPLNKHDLLRKRDAINWEYQNERLLEIIMNYDKYSLYKNDTTMEI